MFFKRIDKIVAAGFIITATAGFITQNSSALAQASTPPIKSLADRVNSSEQNYTSPQIISDQGYSAFGLPCDVTLDATLSAGAMVTLDFKAPCHANESMTITHQGLQFTSLTSDIGTYTVQIPAMAVRAKFDLKLTEGGFYSTRIEVNEASIYNRVALQWIGERGLEIHALEMGARQGERGHVWAKSAQTVATAQQARGGYITTLGNGKSPATKHVEIYSFPTGQIQTPGVVRLGIKAEVTANTCNKEIKAQAMQKGAGGGISTVDLAVLMPGCGAIGDVLVLNNILRDLKIAQN